MIGKGKLLLTDGLCQKVPGKPVKGIAVAASGPVGLPVISVLEPGYQRGKYSMEELRRLDDYADLLGIELMPCIQTLGHLGQVLHWPAMRKYADNGEVLLADSEETYALLRRMIAAAAAPYRSKRIHIGMDEAHGVGLGAHLRKFGYESPHAIIHRHLLRVKELTDELGFCQIGRASCRERV